MSNERLLQAALDYASKGWRIHPLEPKGKKPLVTDWPNKATTDERTIRNWWSEFPGANIGLATGAGSGVFVLDIDGPDGEGSWTQLVTEVPEIPEETLESTTGKGRHMFFQYPRQREVRNKQSFRPGLDIRGEGGYVVLPPSIHPSGRAYDWPYGERTPVATAPVKLLNIIAPPKTPTRRPWDPPEPVQSPPAPAPAPVPAPEPAPKPPDRLQATPVIERASLYLRECESAVQGAGGHNALLWAARAMVVGFELSDADALALLWAEYNPRCSPPWNRESAADVKDFERKIDEARRTPGEKPVGWLLDEYGLRSGSDALAALGAKFRDGLLASDEGKKQVAAARIVGVREESPAIVIAKEDQRSGGAGAAGELPARRTFPLHCFPAPLADCFRALAEAQQVDVESIAALSLPVAGAAIGNTHLLRIMTTDDFDVRPILWVLLVGRSGSNKTGPFKKLKKPMERPLPPEMIINPMANPQPQDALVEDVTAEAIVRDLSHAPRGLLLVNGEASGWIGAFDRYTKGGKKNVSVDESKWLKWYDGDSYRNSRKTDDERTCIHVASVSVMGATQPSKLNDCIDPSNFYSGLVPRLLIVRMSKRRKRLCRQETPNEITEIWPKVVTFLRALPFASFNPNTGEYMPHVLKPSPTAFERFNSEYNRLDEIIFDLPEDDPAALFLSKAAGSTGRIAIVLHGMEAACGEHEMSAPVSENTMLKAIELQQWFTDEQLFIYGLASHRFEERQLESLMEWIRSKKIDQGRTTARETHQHHRRRYAESQDARRDLNLLVEQGKLRREGKYYLLI